MTPTPTCTSHCRGCGRHFHGDKAFDRHRVFLDPKYPDWRDRVCADPDLDERFERWTDRGRCDIGGRFEPVTVYRLRMTESQARSIAKFKAARQAEPERAA